MKFVDEFRNPELIKATAAEITRLVGDAHYRIMEVCGGHTHSIYRFGLEQLLPEGIELIHGPGCPVCILPMERVDEGLAIANNPKVILTAYGDMMRVPGYKGSPLELKARGLDIRMVYSPLDAVKLAQNNPDREVVFFAIGFETTAPATALTVLKAQELGLKNFTVFVNHVTVIPPMRAVLDDPKMQIDGFIAPGHVATVIGAQSYEEIARDYKRPMVVSGFEPLDILQSLLMLVKQLKAGQARVENQYSRVVTWQPNVAASKVLEQVFELRPSFLWRGLGAIPFSAVKLKAVFADFDAEERFAAELAAHFASQVVKDKYGDAPCGDVLKGLIKPHQCSLFGKECTPERPIGALMVSSEGACAAAYSYGSIGVNAGAVEGRAKGLVEAEAKADGRQMSEEEPEKKPSMSGANLSGVKNG
jgi:hydrogenase expression/formation protein HypD